MADVFLGPVGDDPLSAEVKRLAIRPGDRIVIRVGRILNDQEMDTLAASVISAFKDADYRPPVLVLEDGMGIGLIGPEAPEAPEAEDAAKRAALKVLLDAGHDPAVARAVLGIGPEADVT